jgi:hypothetical protein
MKKAILILMLTGLTYFANAQKVPMSDKGYWVIESSKQNPKQSVIKFYNLDDKLVYQETITGKKVKIDNNRTRKALNQTLLIALEGKTHNEPVLAMELAK